MVLEEGDIADISLDNGIRILNWQGQVVQRPIAISQVNGDMSDKAGYRHYMLKEIFNQPAAIAETLEGRIYSDFIDEQVFGGNAASIFARVRAIQIVACGTSFHAGLVARYWFESIARIPCAVDIASEYRYRDTIAGPDTLFICISQSGETADTLAALKTAKSRGYLATMSICNVPESSMTRESDMVLLTRAGIEIGVASTKAFTTQLTALMLLVLALARTHCRLDRDQEKKLVGLLQSLPGKVNHILELDGQIGAMAERFVNKHHVLYLGRGSMLPIAMEGALKLKEISYIHAEAYAAGELKHGPLALVDEDMPVITVAPNNDLLRKLESNLQEVRARGGELYVFADSRVALDSIDNLHKIKIPPVEDYIAPIVFTVPLQLFAYHVAVLKGVDVDQPRNLAKSVTVE
jgi:glucosamine--fructose-6-phosphate aminotransferase (isomerizing)